MSTTNDSPSNKMTYVRLGKSGLKVSKVILGCMSYGSSKWLDWVLDEEDGIEHIKTAYDMGVNAFDTANAYSNGASEIVLGKAIKQHNLPRDEIVVLTKLYFTVKRPEQSQGWASTNAAEMEKMRYTNQQGLSRKHIFESVKHSLERLQLDYIDVLQCHRFDYNTPIEETMQALHDVVKAGFVRYIGMSSCYAWQFHKMQNYARANGLTEFISMQNLYNAAYREEEREMIPLLQDLQVGMIPWSPLCRGFLTHPFNKRETTRGNSDAFLRMTSKASQSINERIEAIAKNRQVSMAQVALAWCISKPFVSAPIIGSTSLEKLKDLLAGTSLQLTEDEIKQIDEPYESQAIQGFA